MPERNPFEETRQAAQDWSPREQYISRPNTTVGPRNKEVYETRGGDQLGFVQRESDRLSPSGRFTHQGDTIYGPYPRSNSVAMRQVFHPSTGRKSGEAYKSPYGTTTSMTVEPEWYAQRGYDFSYDPGVFDYPMMGESADLYFNNYQRGGSVNPHEETMKAARDWSPGTSDRFVDVGRPRSYPQDQSPMDSGVFSIRVNDPSVNEMRNNYMQVADNRTSRNPFTWPGSQYFGIGGYDFVEDHDPTLENLAYFQEIKDRDARERDAGWHLYANPSWIENKPSIGGDYIKDLWGGKGKVGFRKGLDDDEWNAYAGWGIGF